MGERITDEILEEFAVVAEPDKVAGVVKARYGDLVGRILCDFSFAQDDKRADYMEELRAS